MADDRYFDVPAAAFVRGRSLRDNCPELPEELSAPPLNQLSHTELQELVERGIESGLRLHKFKNTMGLARVKRVLGVLRGMEPEQLLDIGSGRGAFLWPLLDQFPQLNVTAVDHNQQRAADLQVIHDGGMKRLTGHLEDATQLSFEDNAFDVVTMLEVLEHIPDTASALAEICRVGRRFVILSVPSKEDDNPEHIHLFDEKRIRSLAKDQGIGNVNIEYVPGHIIAVLNLSPSKVS